MKKNLAMLMLVGTSLMCASCSSSDKKTESPQATEAVQATEAAQDTTEGNTEATLDETKIESILNDTLDWVTMQYTNIENPSITELSVAQAVPMACSAIEKNHSDLEADNDLYIVPQDIFEETTKNLFGTTYDITTYTPAEFDKVSKAEDGGLRLAVGDWGLATPKFSIANIANNDDAGSYMVTVNYYLYDEETASDSETKLVVNYTVTPNEESTYGYVITNMATASAAQ